MEIVLQVSVDWVFGQRIPIVAYCITMETACLVCGDKATGIHYRVLTCEGCKGFWRRTIMRGLDSEVTGYTCRESTDTCPVTRETRGRCQRCRYLECLRAGMVVDRSAGGPGLRGVSPGQAEQDAVLVELLHSLHTRSE